MRAFLMALSLVAMVGCTLNSGEGNAGPRPETPITGGGCAALETTLRNCGLLTPGTFSECEDPESAEEQCEFECAMAASCADIGVLICRDGDIDELPSNALVRCFESCAPPPFACGDGTTVPGDFVCDFSVDCFNGADEDNCGFQCAGAGFEVDQFRVCDGFADCPQGDDEADCGSDGGLFSCPGFSISEAFVCDGFDDCGDNSDEQDCAPRPPEAEFICD